MTIEQSLEALQPVIQHFQQEIDIICSFCIDGKVRNITYDSSTKTLSEPLPDGTDDNQILVIPHLGSESIKIKIG